MSLLQLPKVIDSVNELGVRVAKLEAMVKELQDAFVIATQARVIHETEAKAKRVKANA